MPVNYCLYFLSYRFFGYFLILAIYFREFLVDKHFSAPYSVNRINIHNGITNDIVLFTSYKRHIIS